MEYSLRRFELTVANYEEYLRYEYALDKLLEVRSKKCMKTMKEKKFISLLRGLKTASIRHIHYIYERGLRRFADEIPLWDAAISFLEYKQSNALLDELLGKAIALHPKKVHFWIKAAEHELQHNNNIHAARVLMQRSMRINAKNATLWTAYFRIEVWNAERAIQRQQKLGISAEAMAETVSNLLTPALVVYRYAKEDLLVDGSTEDLAALLAMHLATVSLPVGTLAGDVEETLLSVRDNLSAEKQVEIALHLLYFHSKKLLLSLETEVASLPTFISAFLPQLLSLFETQSSRLTSETTNLILTRWFAQTVSTVLSTATEFQARQEQRARAKAEGREDEDATDSDDESVEDDEENEADDEEENKEEAADSNEPKTHKVDKRSLQYRVQKAFDELYAARHSPLAAEVDHDVATALSQTLEPLFKTKDGKKVKKEIQTKLLALLESTSELRSSTDSNNVGALALLGITEVIHLLQLSSETAVHRRISTLLTHIYSSSVVGDQALKQLQLRIATAVQHSALAGIAKNNSAAQQVADRKQLIVDIQSWAAVTWQYLVLQRFLHGANDAAEINLLREALPALAPWLIQSTESTSNDEATEVPGSELIDLLLAGSLVDYTSAVDSIVSDLTVVSATQRAHWLRIFVEQSLPNDEEFMMLSDVTDVLNHIRKLQHAFQWFVDKRKRHPQLFAQVNLADIFSLVLQGIDRLMEVAQLDVEDLCSARKTKDTSNSNKELKEVTKALLSSVLTLGTEICPEMDIFWQRRVALLRSDGQHSEANHLQFKRRRLT